LSCTVNTDQQMKKVLAVPRSRWMHRLIHQCNATEASFAYGFNKIGSQR